MFLNIISSVVMLVAILIALLTVDPVIALSSFGGFGLIYFVLIQFFRGHLKRNSLCDALQSTMAIKALQEGLGGIRDVLINGSQKVYCEIYQEADIPSRRAQGSSAFISSSPRYVMEALGMILIAVLAYTLAQQVDGISKAIPVLGALALGAQRLLPVLHLTYASWSVIQSGRDSLIDALELLEQPLPDFAYQQAFKPMAFNQQIRLKQLSFRYSQETPWVLKDINLVINKGGRIGFIGMTGSGKSTLLDIIMGLLQPTTGTAEIDGQPLTLENHRSWQFHIAHVPQAIFLTDSSIEENIAFGVPKDQIDQVRVRQAARQAQIADIIEAWPNLYKTVVGERGVRLSGGQRQRIGIARALYKRANVIIFDEATSALDNETEQAVMQSIEALNKDLTILIIAHRLSTLENCTQIVELGNGSIKRTGTYKEIVSKAA